MSIPQKVDKWIVFSVTFLFGTVYYPTGTGIPFEPLIWLVTSLLSGALFTTSYLVWCALCRWLTRRYSRNSVLMGPRIVANATYAVLIAVLVLWPHKTITEAVRTGAVVERKSESLIGPA
jgi:hypothetical protein